MVDHLKKLFSIALPCRKFNQIPRHGKTPSGEDNNRSFFVILHMQFTDIVFAIFMAVFFPVYWFLLRDRTKLQNVWLLTASYLFYGWWDWRFLLLIIITSASSYGSALMFERTGRKWPITANIILNLGILVAFKYFNFFTENIARLLSLFGLSLDWFTLDVLLPVGISFYTFQAIGYTIDVARRRCQATHDIVGFFTFIAFFPQLVAGPIESARSLLPQILRRRVWSERQVISGLRMVLYGLLKKVCVANMLAIYVERIFVTPDISPLLTLVGGILFSLQLYCDFSAYSEIARGCAAMSGIELMVNFRFPYFSRNILEFWQRWHISLMLWFRDYLYIPLGGNRKGETRTLVNYAIVFLLSGLWHGAAWNFVFWGIYWAIWYIAGRTLLRLDRRPEGAISLADLPRILLTFGVVAFGFYIFRSPDISYILTGLRNCWIYVLFFGLLSMLSLIMRPLLARIRISPKLNGDIVPTICTATPAAIAIALTILAGLNIWTGTIPEGIWIYLLKFWWLFPACMILATEWSDRNGDYPFCRVPARRPVRLLLYWGMSTLIILSEPTEMTFIYFQF